VKAQKEKKKYPPLWFVRASEGLRLFFLRMNRRFTHPNVVLWGMVHNMWMASGIGVAAELGLADLLKQGPRHVAELAREIGSDEESLYRLLRMLASEGIFRQGRRRTFENTSLSLPLQEEGIRYLLIAQLGPGQFELFSKLMESVKSGQPVPEYASGRELFEHIGGDSTRNDYFNRAMSDVSRMQVPALLPVFPFHRYGVIADIGGGQGHFLTAILEDCPSSKGILFDLPVVLQQNQDADSDSDVSESAPGASNPVPAVMDRLSRISGDFFQEVPAGADLYMMKNILHDWNDEDVLKILFNIARAMSDKARLLIIEAVLEEDNSPSFAKMTDILMMISAGGKERTRLQWVALFTEAGFRICRVHPTVSPHRIIELEKL